MPNSITEIIDMQIRYLAGIDDLADNILVLNLDEGDRDKRQRMIKACLKGIHVLTDKINLLL